MKLIEYVQVDHLTRVPTTEAPAKHGPADPITGIDFLWFVRGNPARYYGRVADTADTTVPGVLRVLAGADLAAAIEARKIEMFNEAAAIRYSRETGGITLPDGTVINTEREAQAMLSGAYQSLLSGLVADTDWKAASGWVTVSLTELEPIAQAVADHVRRCFRAERQVANQISNAATVDELVAIDLNTDFITAYSA
jgi:hypothetical protein